MTYLCSCAMCVLAFLTTESLVVAAAATQTTTVNADEKDCLHQDLQHGYIEWNSEAYRRHGCVVINWNMLSQTVSVCSIDITVTGFSH